MAAGILGIRVTRPAPKARRLEEDQPKIGGSMAVGVFDSGLGGLTVLDAVSRHLPDVPFVYLGDNAHAPYGVRTQ